MNSRRIFRVALFLALAGVASVDAGAQFAAPDPLAQLEAESLRVLGVLETAQAKRREIEGAEGRTAADKARAREELTKHARALYRITRAGMLPLAGGVNAMLGHLSRVDRLRRVVEREATELSQIDTRAASRRAELAEATSVIAGAERSLRDLEARKAQLASERFLAEQNALAFGAAYGTAPMAGGETRYPEGTIRLSPEHSAPVREEAPRASAAIRSRIGSLAMPIAGATSTDDRADGSLLLIGTSGASVRSADDGRVIVAETRAAYGKLVIVDHGDRIFTVYGGLGEFDVAPGDVVSRGARIGSAGERGIRFEVREGSQKLDARQWL